MKNKLKVGLTGGIGSGKSTIAKIFIELGYPVYFADDRAKLLMNSSSDLVAKIKSLMGNEAYRNNLLDRRFVAQKVFKDKALLERLNSIVHPAVAIDFETWCQQQNTTIVFKEAALIFENNSQKSLDKTILVIAPRAEKIRRIQKRDADRSVAEIEAIMNKQLTDDIKVSLADFVINNGNSDKVLPQVLEVLSALKAC